MVRVRVKLVLQVGEATVLAVPLATLGCCTAGGGRGCDASSAGSEVRTVRLGW